MEIVFLGTPEFAQICMEQIKNSHHKIVAIICSEDKICGRGQKMQMPPAKIFGLQNNIPVYQFKSIRKHGVELVKSLKPQIMVAGAFGQILSQELIDIPTHHIINIHGSLLPAYRGASPVQTAVLNGERITGVTIMRTEAGIDTGDILISEKVDILPEDTSGTLMKRMAQVGGKLCVKALDLIESGQDKFLWQKQDESKATFTKMFKKEDSQINFENTADQIANFVRAFNPNPISHFVYDGQIFKVYFAVKYTNVDLIKNQYGQKEFSCGEIVFANPKRGLVVSCGDGFVEITSFQAPNGKIMPPKAYLNGKSMTVGTILNK